MPVLHLRGRALPTGEELDLWVDGDRLRLDPVPGAETVHEGGWLVPGLVDVHTHPGTAGPGSPLDEDLLREHGRAHVEAGELLVRAPGTPAPLPAWFGEDEGTPRAQSAGNWLVQPGRFFKGWGREVPGPDVVAALAAAAAEEARHGGWAKVVGDWSGTRPDGEKDYWPTFPLEAYRAVADAVHLTGGRVTVHAQCPEVTEAAVEAGFDCVEHGMLADRALLERMAERGTALVPTLTIFSNIPGSAARRPPGPLRDFITAGWDRHPAMVREAHEIGVHLLAGTDAAGRGYGTVAEEVRWLVEAGVPGHAALGAASWDARSYLGMPGLAEGAPADVVAYEEDPRADLTQLARPARVVARGRVVR